MAGSDSLLLLVDLQEGLIAAGRTLDEAGLRRGARALVRVALALGIPCAASGIPVGPAGLPPLLREVTQAAPDLALQPRRSFGAFATVADRLRPGGTLLLAGVAIEAAVLRTALEARAAGLEVQVVLDASAGLSARTEGAALRRIEAAGATLTSVASLAAERVDDLGTPAGQAVLGALRGLMG